jgi:uncharacterized protein with NAD-binding domain and iron-sulfur cluster
VINTHKTVSKQSLTSITNHSVSNRPQNSTYTIIDTLAFDFTVMQILYLLPENENADYYILHRRNL